MTDEAMVNELRSNLLDAGAPNPSVETLLHAFLPARFVDHTHADAILALADQPEARKIFARSFGKGLVWIPYVMPGFALAKRCAEAFEAVAAHDEPTVMVLEKHGLFTWGATAQESYERTIDAVSRAELLRGRSQPHRGAVGRRARRRVRADRPAAPARLAGQARGRRARARPHRARPGRRRPSCRSSSGATWPISSRAGARRPITCCAPSPRRCSSRTGVRRRREARPAARGAPSPSSRAATTRTSRR